jgi:hypothetical protein
MFKLKYFYKKVKFLQQMISNNKFTINNKIALTQKEDELFTFLM